MGRRIIFVFICLVFVACSGEKAVVIPDSVLSKEKMAEVMLDIHLMEASMNISGVNPNTIDLAGSKVPLNIDVLKKHNLTKKQYDESFSFYSNHPELLSQVYQQILNDLSKLQAEVSNKK